MEESKGRVFECRQQEEYGDEKSRAARLGRRLLSFFSLPPNSASHLRIHTCQLTHVFSVACHHFEPKTGRSNSWSSRGLFCTAHHRASRHSAVPVDHEQLSSEPGRRIHRSRPGGWRNSRPRR